MRYGVEATTFEPQVTAYPGTSYDSVAVLGVSLPFKFEDPDKFRVNLWYRNIQLCNVKIIDVGPWNVSDGSWLIGNLQGMRPRVEVQFKYKILADNGRIPTNKAAIDLSYGVCDALDLPHRWKGEIVLELVSKKDTCTKRLLEPRKDSQGRLVRVYPQGRRVLVCAFCKREFDFYLIPYTVPDCENEDTTIIHVCKYCRKRWVRESTSILRNLVAFATGQFLNFKV